MGYVLVPTVLTGAHEWMAHLTQLVLVWIAVVAMTSLIFRFGWDRWHATAGALLLVAIPPFLPMASTAMPDILATALALVAMERLAAWKAEAEMEPGRSSRYRAGTRRLCAVAPCASSTSRGIFSAGKHRIPGRFLDRSAGDSGFGPRSSQALSYCWQSFSLSVSITWPSVPLPLPDAATHAGQSLCISAVLRVSSTAGRLLAGEPFEGRPAEVRFHPVCRGSHSLAPALEIVRLFCS